MVRYSPERKAALLKKLLPPHNMSVAASREEGVSEPTLYNWRNQAKAHGVPVPGDKNVPDDWSADAKLAVVIETAALSEIELSEYCRRKGLYVDQVRDWRQACLDGQQSSDTPIVESFLKQRQFPRSLLSLGTETPAFVQCKLMDAGWKPK